MPLTQCQGQLHRASLTHEDWHMSYCLRHAVVSKNASDCRHGYEDMAIGRYPRHCPIWRLRRDEAEGFFQETCNLLEEPPEGARSVRVMSSGPCHRHQPQIVGALPATDRELGIRGNANRLHDRVIENALWRQSLGQLACQLPEHTAHHVRARRRLLRLRG